MKIRDSWKEEWNHAIPGRRSTHGKRMVQITRSFLSFKQRKNGKQRRDSENRKQ